MIGDTARRTSRIPLFEVTALGGFGLGVAIALLAFLLARYGPSGGGPGGAWSFRGNGALAAYSAFPAVLVGGWTALAVRSRGRDLRATLVAGAVAGAAGLVLAGLAAAVLPVWGASADGWLTPLLLVAALAWTAAAPLLASHLRLPRHADRLPGDRFVVAGGIWAGTAAAGLVVMSMLAPAGS